MQNVKACSLSVAEQLKDIDSHHLQAVRGDDVSLSAHVQKGQ